MGYMDVFLDLTPNEPRTDEARRSFENTLRDRFEADLPAAVERIWDLPPIMLQRPQAEYLDLLLEARALYVAGRFYGCVAMSGIVGERLIKDAVRASVVVRRGGATIEPSPKAFDQLERVEMPALIGFLKETALLGDEAAKAARDLGQLRNDYAHARGKTPPADAAKALKLLHVIVEDTVSVFKDFDVKDGLLVRKTPA